MDPNSQERILLRLKTIEGHLHGVVRMVEGQRPCLEVIWQVRALQGALGRVTNELVSEELGYWLERLAASDDSPTATQAAEHLTAIYQIVGAASADQRAPVGARRDSAKEE